MESDVVTIIPVRSHPPPTRRLITRQTTIRPYVFRKPKSEEKEGKQEKSLTKKNEPHKSPLKTKNSSDINYQNNIRTASNSSISKSDLNVSKKKESSKKKKTSRCNVSQLSENVENISSVKTRSATHSLSQSLTDFKPTERAVSSKNASLMSLSSKSRNAFPENLRSSSHRVDDRISQSFSIAQNTAVPLSESESCSYSTDAILICRPANESNSELDEGLSKGNVSSHTSASNQTFTNPASFCKQSVHTAPMSSEKVIQTKSILKVPIKKDNKINELACPEALPDIQTPISKRKHSHPVNLSFQFKKLKNSGKNRSTLQNTQKGNKKNVSLSSKKKNTTKDWMDQSTMIEGNNVPTKGLGSHSSETTFAANMSNSINEKSFNCSAWKDGEVLPVLESTRYSLMPRNKQLDKEDLNSPEAHSSLDILVNQKAANLSKSVRWNMSVSYQIVSPSPKVKRRLRRNLGKAKAVGRKKAASVLKVQKEIQSEENPSTSTSTSNLELSKEKSSQLQSSQKPKASEKRSPDTKKMILRKKPRQKKNVARSGMDVYLDTALQTTEKFRKHNEDEDTQQITRMLCEFLTEKIKKRTEDSKDSAPSKKNGKADIKTKNLKLEVMRRNEDLKRLKEKLEEQEIKLQKEKRSASRKEEINLFLFKLQDFHQRIMY